MSSSSKEIVLITGASAGIGYELAKIFAREGYPLALVARGGDRLHRIAEDFQKTYRTKVRVLVKDLTDPEAPDEIFAALGAEAANVGILVNNAGFGNHGFFTETDLKSELEMIQLNVTSLTHLAKLFLREMVKKKRGKILNVSSTAAFQPGPLMAVYYAGKAYVLSLSEALAEECRGRGITVTCLCPGPTASEFQARAGIQGLRLLKRGTMSSEEVARAGYEGLMKGKRVVVPGFLNQVLALSVRLTPRLLLTRIVKYLQEGRSTQSVGQV